LIPIRAAFAAAVAAVALAQPIAAVADKDAKRSIAILEFRGGSDAVPQIGTRAAKLLRSKSSLRIVDAEEARTAKGGRVDAAIAKCGGEARCVAGVGRVLGVDEVLLIGVSEFGDVILTLQRIDVKRRRVLSRVAEALAPGQDPDEETLAGYLRRVLPKEDFVRHGTIRIKANVTGAHVTIGGEQRGKTPMEPQRVIAPASYDISVDKAGYVGFRATVDVPPDAVVQVRPVLTRANDAWYKKWWVAAIAGTVVAGAVTVAIVATRDDPTDVDVNVPPFGGLATFR